MLVNNPPIILDGLEYVYICDININKNGNALSTIRWKGLTSPHVFDISTHDNDEFCSFRIPSLGHWPLQELSGVYVICQTIPEFHLFYAGQTDNLPARFNFAYGHISKKHFNLHSARINKKIYAEIEAGNLLQIYFHKNVPDESVRKDIEGDLIHKYNPDWNKQGRSDGLWYR